MLVSQLWETDGNNFTILWPNRKKMTNELGMAKAEFKVVIAE